MKELFDKIFKDLGYENNTKIVKSNKDSDFQCDDCFRLAKEYHTSPMEIGKNVVDKINEDKEFSKYFKEVTFANPGFINIKVSDIDFNNRRIRVLGKGNKERIVYYGEYAEDVLKEYIATHDRNRENYLFTNSKGDKITDRGIRYIIDKIMSKLAVKVHVTPHVLRHTFATDMLNNGCDIKVVQELLGHSSLKTTEVYTHVTNERLKEVYYNCFPRRDKNE